VGKTFLKIFNLRLCQKLMGRHSDTQLNSKTLYSQWGGRKPTYLTSATSVLTSIKAVSIVPSGRDKTDVRRENTDIRWVGFHLLFTILWF
jgi:hypothetical protein